MWPLPLRAVVPSRKGLALDFCALHDFSKDLDKLLLTDKAECPKPPLNSTDGQCDIIYEEL